MLLFCRQHVVSAIHRARKLTLPTGVLFPGGAAMFKLGLALSILGLLGTLFLWLQWIALWRHQSRAPVRHLSPKDFPGISVLKPLCGVDEDLEANLDSFARLQAPAGRFEVLLGVRDASDPAYRVARAQVQRHPDIFRLFLQQGEPGLNPKVNQLITLERYARFALVVVSDSNVRVGRDYLEDIAALMSVPDVGCVTHPVAGAGERSWGARLDNLHLTTSTGPGMVAAQRIAGLDLVVGKSMALWRDDLALLGGFMSVKDLLAEDHVLGNRISAELNKRVVISSLPVFNIAASKKVSDFFRRYRRWAVIHRTAVSPATYVGQSLMNPLPLALLGCLFSPSRLTGAALAIVLGFKSLADLACIWTLRGRARSTPDALRTLLAIPSKDALLFLAWAYGLFARTVDWRGNRLRVTRGSRLVPAEAAPTLADPSLP